MRAIHNLCGAILELKPPILGVNSGPGNVSSRGRRHFRNIGFQAPVSVIPAKAVIQNPVAGNCVFSANSPWITAFAGMTVNMTTLPKV